jgi:hypothetical protein
MSSIASSNASRDPILCSLQRDHEAEVRWNGKVDCEMLDEYFAVNGLPAEIIP